MFEICLSELEKEANDDIDINKEKDLLEMENVAAISIRKCSNEQINILESTEKRVLVTGPAGSGKSMIAMIKAMDLYNNNVNFKIIIYTKALSRYIIGRLKRVELKNIEKNILVGESFINRDIEINANYVLIDEVQDYSIEKIEKCCGYASDGYLLFGDDSQQVYPKRTNKKDIISELRKKKIKESKLSVAYRFPKKIALFSELIKDNPGDISSLCSEVGSEENIPKIIEFKSGEDEIEYIINIISNEGWKDVGILARNNPMVDYLNECFLKKKFVCEYKNKDYDNLDFTTDVPKIVTYHSSKGLEFDRVIIPQCDVDEDEKSELNYREAFYVACTRAKKTLIISYISGHKSPFLNRIDKKYYKFEGR
ncbi:MAG: hypothetical protein E7214_03985 [Clostridium sp.]|nr:hypothetical protein [Clostridium sp.]